MIVSILFQTFGLRICSNLLSENFFVRYGLRMSFKPGRSRKPCVYYRRKNNSRGVQGSVGGVFGASEGVELK